MSLLQKLYDDRMRFVAKTLGKQLKRAKKRVVDRQQILDQCHQWQPIYHQGILLQSNLFRIHKGMTNLVVADWEQEGKEISIPLDAFIDPQDQLKAMFRRSKKLKTGIPYAEKQLILVENELSKVLQQQAAFEKITSLEELDAFCKVYNLDFDKNTASKTAEIKKKEPVKPYNAYTSASGFQIWVGKNAKGNDKLSFHYANGLDWWLHAKDYPGSHVVIHGTHGQEPDVETLKDAAELALRFSKAKDRHEGEVCLTQVKALKRVKGIPGKVMLSKHKTLHVKLDEARWNKLRAIRDFGNAFVSLPDTI